LRSPISVRLLFAARHPSRAHRFPGDSNYRSPRRSGKAPSIVSRWPQRCRRLSMLRKRGHRSAPILLLLTSQRSLEPPYPRTGMLAEQALV